MTDRHRLHAWIGPTAIAATFCALTAWSWRKWPDILVDFGQQLYIPWQLAGGQLLYRDIAYLHGPLSQLFNAGWFRLFGASLTVLIGVNLAILAVLTSVVYRLAKRQTDGLTATVATVVFLSVFGFAQYVGVGNYNFVCPYTHEAAHGTLLIAAMVLFMSDFLQSGRQASAVLAGLCLGGAILTRSDVAVAAPIVAAAGGALSLAFRGRRPASTRRRDLLLFAASALAPALGCFVYFLSYLPFKAALTAVFGAFGGLLSGVGDNRYFRQVMGLDDAGGNLDQMLGMFVRIVGFAGAVAVADVVSRPLWRPRQWMGVALGAIVFLILIANPNLVPWPDLPRALPLTTLLGMACFLEMLVRFRDQDAVRTALVPMVLWTVFALVMLAKIVLDVHVYHYGFYLAMPATIALVICLVYWIPRGLATTFGGGGLFKPVAYAVLAAGLVFHLGRSQEFYRSKTFAIGTGGDVILTYGPDVPSPAAVTDQALRWIDANMARDATFVGLPEGITLNYLSRHPTSVPEIDFMMTEMIIFGEERMLSDLARRPPDYVVLVDKDTSDYGIARFGTDSRYGQRIMDWVHRYYRRVALFGNEPFRGNPLGIEILKRADG